MSGGILDYAYGKVHFIGCDIAQLITDNFKNNKNEDYEYDYLNECTPEQRKQFIKSMKRLVKKLDTTEKELHALEWFLSGDYGYDTYIEEINKIGKNENT